MSRPPRWWSSRLFDPKREAWLARAFVSAHREGERTTAADADLLRSCAEDLRLRLPDDLGELTFLSPLHRPLALEFRKGFRATMEWVARPDVSGIRFDLRRATILRPSRCRRAEIVPDQSPRPALDYATRRGSLRLRLRENHLSERFFCGRFTLMPSDSPVVVPGVGPVPAPEMFIGYSAHGRAHVVSVRYGDSGVSAREVQTDMAWCRYRFPDLVARAVGAQFLENGVIALMECDLQGGEVGLVREAHYRLVPYTEIGPEELERYRAAHAL